VGWGNFGSGSDNNFHPRARSTKTMMDSVQGLQESMTALETERSHLKIAVDKCETEVEEVWSEKVENDFIILSPQKLKAQLEEAKAAHTQVLGLIRVCDALTRLQQDIAKHKSGIESERRFLSTGKGVEVEGYMLTNYIPRRTDMSVSGTELEEKKQALEAELYVVEEIEIW